MIKDKDGKEVNTLKQTFIFCPKCTKDTKNFVVCMQHAYEYEDTKKMEENEK